MCGRFVYYGQPGSLLEEFDIAGEAPSFEPDYNIAPGSLTPVIVRQGSNQAALLKWGLVPSWSESPRSGYKMINARAEGIQDKPAFRRPIRAGRCLVPANGFYEWQRPAPGAGNTKLPHFIHLRGRQLFAFAGIFDVWRDAEGHEMRSYAIITSAPNELMAPIHNRMPVILPREQQDAWLDPSTGLDRVLAMLRPYPAAEMAAHPVSKFVNSAAAHGPELAAPLAGG